MDQHRARTQFESTTGGLGRGIQDWTAIATKAHIRTQVRRLSRASSRSRSRIPLGLTLAPDSDSGLLGDSKTSLARIDLLGLTAPNAVVNLSAVSFSGSLDGSLTVRADTSGSFLFRDLPLDLGATQFTVQRGSQQFTTTIQRQTSDAENSAGNAVLTWNALALQTLRRDRAGSLEASRTLAILHAAVLDAVNALSPRPIRSYRPLPVPAPTGGSAEIAAAGAAHRVLTQLYPNQQPLLDAALNLDLSRDLNRNLSETAASGQASLAFGATVATALLNERSQDGSSQTQTYRPQIRPGSWRPTPPRFLPAAAPGWARVTPFLLSSGSQLRPAPPPPLTSSTYARELNQVKRLGQLESRDRTAQQTETARFWLGNSGTFTFPGMWNLAAADLLTRSKPDQLNQPGDQTDPLLSQARLFARLNLALADAAIATWDAKYHYRTWRPITAIRLAGRDGNPATQPDPSWQSLLETPAHPDYVSAHSTYAGAAAALLDQTFGNIDLRPRFTSLDFPGPERSFASFARAAAQAGLSRIYGGIHTRSANQSGLKLGQAIGRVALRRI